MVWICRMLVVVLGCGAMEANAGLVRSPMRDGEVFAVCHYLDNDGQKQNDVLQLYTDTGKVGFGGVWGVRDGGRIIFSSEHFIAAEIVIADIGITITPFYLATILIDLKNRKYLKSEIQMRGHCPQGGCEYEVAAFEGECYQIIGHPRPVRD